MHFDQEFARRELFAPINGKSEHPNWTLALHILFASVAEELAKALFLAKDTRWEGALMLHQPTLQDLDRCDEVPVHTHQHVDIVPISFATETVREIILWIHRRSQLATRWTLEPEVPLDFLTDRALTTKPLEHHAHWLVIA